MKQISVFIENRPGTLTDILQLLKSSNIQLHAISIADTAEYGICRIICDEYEKAVEIFKNAGIAAALADIVALEMEDRPGSAADIVSAFASEGVNLAFLYTFIKEGRFVMAFRPDNMVKAKEVIKEYGFKNIG